MKEISVLDKGKVTEALWGNPGGIWRRPQRSLQQERGRGGVDEGHSSFKYSSSGFFFVFHVGFYIRFQRGQGL